MRRDFDLIREILLECESADEEILWVSYFDVDEDGPSFGFGERQRAAHFKLLKEAGMVHEEFSGPDKDGNHLYGYRISWAGYDFLDTIRDSAIWRQTKAGATALGGASINVITSLAIGFAKRKATELGLPLD